MASMPFRQQYRQNSRQYSSDPHNELNVHMDHYIGIDVGTGSARACIINAKGDIVGLASENIGLWQPEQGYYVNTALPQRRDQLPQPMLICCLGAINQRHLALYLLFRPTYP